MILTFDSTEVFFSFQIKVCKTIDVQIRGVVQTAKQQPALISLVRTLERYISCYVSRIVLGLQIPTTLDQNWMRCFALKKK